MSSSPRRRPAGYRRAIGLVAEAVIARSSPSSPGGAVASPPLFGDRIVTGAFGVSGASASTPGDSDGGSSCAAPVDPVVSWVPPVDPPPSSPPPAVADPPLPVASPPLSGEAIVTGALAVTGAAAATAGETSTAPTCAAPVESPTSWSAAPAESSPLDVLAAVSPARVEVPPLFGERTVTGALAVTGASAATPASGSTESTWADPLESLVSCSALAPAESPEPDAEAPVSPSRLAFPPLLGEATVTGALAVTGASAAALVDPSAEPT